MLFIDRIQKPCEIRIEGTVARISFEGSKEIVTLDLSIPEEAAQLALYQEKITL